MGKNGIVLLAASAVVLASTSVLVLPALAEESRYSLASYQPGEQINVAPGHEGQGAIYFYNVDGTRTTHITLTVTQPPEGMEVEIRPPLHEFVSTVNGAPVTVSENLHVDPSALLSEPPDEVPEGMACFNVPGRGYALAVPAYFLVRAPASAQIGTTAELAVTAQAEWLGQTGAVVMRQERNFTFSVTVATESSGFTETTTEPNSPYTRWLLSAVIGTAALLGGLFTWRLVVQRRKRTR